MTLNHAHQPLSLYNTDFVLWAEKTAQALRERRLEELDWENLIEEIESLSRAERQQLVSRLEVLIGHLLKWQYQPHRRSNSWEAAIREQRLKIERLLKSSPSLTSFLDTAVEEGFVDGVNLAVRETNLPFSTFPKTCPYSVDEILGDGFFPK
ncbi:MAG: DUF29 domain-containing protein [Chroococcidiopsidaceae cyanobacterium CP_BM_ER_R8_30]|nr:DUF29 domain-containing protein [Chroococcidiopsidaceae cyanobacterium CP_BM_ER_R8_30]